MLRDLFVQCLINPLFITTNEGRRVLSHVFGSNDQAELMHSAIKEIIPTAKGNMLSGFGELYVAAWLHSCSLDQYEGEERTAFVSIMSECAYYSVYSANNTVSSAFGKICSSIIGKRSLPGVEKLLSQMYAPFILRALQAPNPLVRLQATKAMASVFPLTIDSENKSDKELEQDNANYVAKQLNIMQGMLNDDETSVRAIACQSFAKIVALYWNTIPEHLTKKYVGICA